MHTDLNLQDMKKEWHGSLKAYLIGFTTSILLTSIAFLLVIEKLLPKEMLIVTIVTLALGQAVCQLLFFLHVGQEAKPRWETLIFCFMMLVLLIIAVGSLWIMYDLDVRTMSHMPY